MNAVLGLLAVCGGMLFVASLAGRMPEFMRGLNKGIEEFRKKTSKDR